jgi:Putative beta barrel porin-7 (BBP7)
LRTSCFDFACIEFGGPAPPLAGSKALVESLHWFKLGVWATLKRSLVSSLNFALSAQSSQSSNLAKFTSLGQPELPIIPHADIVSAWSRFMEAERNSFGDRPGVTEMVFRGRNGQKMLAKTFHISLLARPVAFALAFGIGSASLPAWGQLRTGRETRALYHEQLLSEQRSMPANQNSKVVRASHAEQAGPGSILESGSASAVGSGVDLPQATASEIIDGEHLVSGSPMNYEGTGACDDFCQIAPTCAGICDPCGDYLSSCGPIGVILSRMSARIEAPLFWRRAADPPVLVTTGTGASNGELGNPTPAGTQILFGGRPIADDANAGFRLNLGTWLGADQHYGLQFRYWTAGKKEDNFNFSSDQTPLLSRPFLNTETNAAGTQTVQVISRPGDTTGNISIASISELNGINISLQRLVYRDRFNRIDWLHGYQHVGIDEQLNIDTNTVVIANRLPGLGSAIAVSDRFATQNDFHGGVNGLMHTREFGGLRIESLFRLGMGNLRRKVNISGTTTTTSAPPTVTSFTRTQGLLARNTNSTPFVDDTFIVVPEVGINLAYCLRPNLDFSIGYNYMLVPKVAQASRQFDSRLAANLSDPLTGSADPRFRFEERKYWINSLGLGIQWKY